MSNRKKTSSSEADVDMTPMLDIVFIMLIFFIVSSTFIHENGVDITEHNSEENNTDKSSKSIVVKICENKNIYINKRSIDIRSVRANIERKLAEDENTSVIIESEEKASTGALVMVMDQARAAKASISVSPSPAGCDENTATAM